MHGALPLNRNARFDTFQPQPRPLIIQTITNTAILVLTTTPGIWHMPTYCNHHIGIRNVEAALGKSNRSALLSPSQASLGEIASCTRNFVRARKPVYFDKPVCSQQQRTRGKCPPVACSLTTPVKISPLLVKPSPLLALFLKLRVPKQHKEKLAIPMLDSPSLQCHPSHKLYHDPSPVHGKIFLTTRWPSSHLAEHRRKVYRQRRAYQQIYASGCSIPKCDGPESHYCSVYTGLSSPPYLLWPRQIHSFKPLCTVSCEPSNA